METANDERIRLRAVLISLAVGLLLLATKFWAWHETLSTAVLSDALEGIVNVVAAAFALGSVVFAGRPADRNHPYGHGKIEFFTAAFEGGLISFAAVYVAVHLVHGFMHGAQVQQVDLGMALIFGSGLINAALGWFLIRTGRRHNSLALVADGRHVLSDFVTSAGVIIALYLVRTTGWAWIDLVVAGLIALNLVRTGFKLVRLAAAGLLDEEDREVLERLVAASERSSVAGIIRIHHLRAIRAGRFHHVDAHLVVPEFWDVERAHQASNQFAAGMFAEFGAEGEVIFHTDPCRRTYCAQCDLPECPVRLDPFKKRLPLTVDEAVRADPEDARFPLGLTGGDLPSAG